MPPPLATKQELVGMVLAGLGVEVDLAGRLLPVLTSSHMLSGAICE